MHPLAVDKWQNDTGEEINALAASDKRVVAIGETGLDFYKADNQEKQILVLQQQLKIAKKLKKTSNYSLSRSSSEVKRGVNRLLVNRRFG